MIYNNIDLTLLKPAAVDSDYINLIEKAHRMSTASICIPPSYIRFCREYIKEKQYNIKICTVIGFPNGYNSLNIKKAEAEEAYNCGADEIDCVINIGYFKNSLKGQHLFTANEIRTLSDVSHRYNGLTKIIIESAEMNESEIRELCHLCAENGADFIKTSTGFSKAGGASIEAVATMIDEIKKCGLSLKVKASGGIHSIKDFETYTELGCSRIGASNIP